MLELCNVFLLIWSLGVETYDLDIPALCRARGNNMVIRACVPYPHDASNLLYHDSVMDVRVIPVRCAEA